MIKGNTTRREIVLPERDMSPKTTSPSFRKNRIDNALCQR